MFSYARNTYFVLQLQHTSIFSILNNMYFYDMVYHIFQCTLLFPVQRTDIFPSIEIASKKNIGPKKKMPADPTPLL
jgi:hypothetical protein